MSVRRALAVAAALPLLLAGCSEGEAEPKMPDPSPSSSSSTPTAEPTAEQETPEEFVRRWVKAGDKMQVTGETDEYSAMSPKCEPCQGFVDSVADVYESGGYAEFAGTTVTDVRSVGQDPPTLDVSMSVPITRIHREGTDEVETLPAGKTKIRVTLGRFRGSYVVRHFGIL